MSPPNWKLFQTKVQEMIETDLIGGETCTITIPATITYNYTDGEVRGTEQSVSITTALIRTTKDDLIELPEGKREKVHKKIFTVNPIVKYNKIVSDFDGTKYKVIVPSASYNAGGLVHAYVTFLGKVET